ASRSCGRVVRPRTRTATGCGRGCCRCSWRRPTATRMDAGSWSPHWASSRSTSRCRTASPIRAKRPAWSCPELRVRRSGRKESRAPLSVPVPGSRGWTSAPKQACGTHPANRKEIHGMNPNSRTLLQLAPLALAVGLCVAAPAAKADPSGPGCWTFNSTTGAWEQSPDTLIRTQGNEHGDGNSTCAPSANAYGAGNNASAVGSSALGEGNIARGTRASAFGWGNTVSGSNESNAFGSRNEVDGDASNAIGRSNTVSGGNSSGVGNNNTVAGDNAAGIGVRNTASGFTSTAFGAGNTVTASGANGFGSNNQAGGGNSSAFGRGNIANGLMGN